MTSICFVLCLIAPTKSVVAEQVSCGANITLELPSAYEVLAGATPQIPCRVRHRDAGLPTFNIVRTPGSAPNAPAFTESVMGARLVESYHAVGLTDAEFIEGSYIDIAARRSFQGLLSYSNGATKMSSYVLVIEGIRESYVLTATQRADDFAATASEIKRIAASVKLPAELGVSDAEGDDARALKSQGTGFRLWGALVLAVVLVLGVVTFWRRRTLRQRTP